MINLIDAFQHRVKCYAGILFIGLGPEGLMLLESQFLEVLLSSNINEAVSVPGGITGPGC